MGSDVSALARLGAPGPFEPHAADLMLFGQLVGVWDVEWTEFADGGQPRERRRGEWRFGWILGGRGVQDVISRSGAPPSEDGTTVRCWDAGDQVWRAVFMSPGDGEYVSLIGRHSGREIVQEVVQDASAPPRRWVFSDIEHSSFRWRAETRRDPGTWELTHEIRATRRA